MQTHKKSEKGQAIILIVFAIIGLIGLTGLTVDGGLVYSDRRQAQNAADSAAFAAALAYSRNLDFSKSSKAAEGAARTNGYNNDATPNTVKVTPAPAPDACLQPPRNGWEFTVVITSQVNTTFSTVVGIQQVTNIVTAKTLACDTYVAPMFNGNAIVSLAPSGKGFDATGNPNWTITGGGIFSNSVSSNSVYCNGSTNLSAPSISTVGNVALGCNATITNGIATGGTQYTWDMYKSQLPPTPDCTGTATFSNGQWHPAANTVGTNIGSNVALNGTMNFSSGLYCVTNNPGNGHYSGAITGTGVTFYVPNSNFTIKFNGGNNSSFNAEAPTGGDYAGILLYVEPQVTNGVLQNTGSIDLRGNGSTNTVGTILAPSADITMFGNSSSAGLINSQIIGYQVDTGGSANIKLEYHSDDNFQTAQPITISLLK
ncbi:MAG: Tad domain-containing protein [Anaerolineales bacterium]|nr:Tad domain-containing protein [Anaerolineales bacterium]